MASQASLVAYKYYLSLSLKRLSPTAIPVSANPAPGERLEMLRKTGGGSPRASNKGSYDNLLAQASALLASRSGTTGAPVQRLIHRR